MQQVSKKVTLFVQCLVDGFYPQVAEAVVKVLTDLDLQVHCPLDQTCCGQLAYNAGHVTEAEKAAKRFVKIFEPAQNIVCPSGSCVTMVKYHYPQIFKNDPSWYQRCLAVGEKTYEFTQYVVDVLGLDEVKASYDGKVTYHDSCHLLRYLGVYNQPRKLIQAVDGAEFVEMKDSDRCCGFGGVFSLKYPYISSAILEEKVKNIQECGAHLVTGCDMSCLMHIQGRLSRLDSPIKVKHIAELLAGF